MLTTYQLQLLKFWQCQRDFPGLHIGEPPSETLESLGMVDRDEYCALWSAETFGVAKRALENQHAEALREFRRME